MLVNRHGQLALADLGLSAQKPSGVSGGFFKPVCTLLYQSPEQLFRSPKGYNEKADMWGLGCILYELLTGRIFFQAAKSQDQLVDIILQHYGAEEFELWEEGRDSEVFKKHAHRLKRTKTIFNGVKTRVRDSQALDLLEALCCLNPEKRPSAVQVLTHPFFDEVSESQMDRSDYQFPENGVRVSRE